jgi:hypothetical protein
MLQKLLLFILIISLCPFARAQSLETKKLEKPEEKLAKLRTQAVAYLSEAMAEANNLRSLENRISFTSELAGLMWYSDEKEAKSMFNGVINDFRELLMQYDTQMNAVGMGPNDGDYNSGFLGDLSDKSRLTRKFSTAMAVRQQIALSLAEHDVETAFNFYYDTKSLVTNPEFRKTYSNRDPWFETKLVMMAVEGKSPKAVQFAARSLEHGFNSQHVELLKKIAEKNPDQAADFGAAILSKIKSDKIDSDDFYAANSLLSFGDENLTASRTTGKKSVYSQADLREMADVFAQSLLNARSNAGFEGVGFLGAIEKYAPGRAAQLRARMGRRTANTNTNAAYYGMSNSLKTTVTSANSIYDEEETLAPTNSNSSNDAARAQREEAEAKSMQDVMSLSGKELPKEEREKIIAQARKLIADTPSREKKIAGLSVLAGQVAAAGDKELAAAIMKDAASFVSTNPKNYQDFLFNWMLVGGYAGADPEKAFPLLEDTISRANDTIGAFVKVAEFMDITGEMVDDGEVQVGAFGGSMIRGVTGELGLADNTIKLLAQADFEKTCVLANRFDRAEVRMLAKMMVLRAVLNEKKPEATLEVDELN